MKNCKGLERTGGAPRLTAMTIRTAVATSIAALATLLAVPAFAHDDAQFPMKAAEFQAKVDAHLARARQHLDRKIEHKKLDAEQAKELRAKLDAATTAVRAEAAKAEADGVVTKEEAKQVRHVFRELAPHGKHARHGHRDGGAPRR